VDELRLLLDLVLAVLAASVGGVLAQRLGQPVILGYLVAGLAIGPFTPGLVVSPHSVELFAEIGVAFLMFALGAEVSLGELRRFGRVLVVGGTLQIVATMALGPLLGGMLGLSFLQGIFLGALLALSSTVVAIKVLMARGEIQALHGRIALGILIAQDIAVVPLAVVLPALTAGGADVLTELGLTAVKAAAVLAGAYLVGARVVPWVLGHVAGARSRELFLLSVVALALGTAVTTALAGLSIAFGAFLAGLAVAETDYRTQVVADTLPFRDLFASLFFVSVGMLIDVQGLLSQLGLVALLAAVTIVGKTAIVTLVVMLIGMPGQVALRTGLSLAQVGEFSFVLASIGVQAEAIPPELLHLTLATALVTIVATPSLLWCAPRLSSWLQRLPAIGSRFAAPVDADPEGAGLRRHVVICGFGRVARELAAALDQRKLQYLVIEYNPYIVRELRARGIPAVYGDAANPVVLEHAHLDAARLLAVLVPDRATTELATQHARALYPRLHIVARAVDDVHVDRLKAAGASEVVQPEFEAGVEVIRHAMERYGIMGLELAHLAAGRRASFYRRGAAARDAGAFDT
jgi:CPA2 family monovalent cation:H+ antiporter-2